MLVIKNVNNLNPDERSRLAAFIESQPRVLPYHRLEFADFVNSHFKYKDLSLAVFDENETVAYLPQWLRKGVIESVPWRDKAGPLYSGEETLLLLIGKTKQLVKEHKAKGFIWKDFNTKLLDNYKYFINVELGLDGLDEAKLWSRIRNRTVLRQSFINNLSFFVEEGSIEGVKRFYSLFVQNRKRLGVPVYSKSFFDTLIKSFKKENIKILSVYKNSEILAAMIMFYDSHIAIEGFVASNKKALRLRANNFLIWSTLKYCLQNNIKIFDFGADSPLQKSLIDYKLKWSGTKREIATSFYGNVREGDHNISRFNLIKAILSKLPNKLFILVSRIIIKLS